MAYFCIVAYDYSTIRKVSLHLVAWIGVILYEQILFLLSGVSPTSIPAMLINYAFNIGLFYINCELLLPKLYERQRYTYYFVALLGLLFAYSFLRSEFYLTIVPFFKLGATPVFNTVTSHFSVFQTWFGQSFYRGTYFLLLSTGYWFTRYAVQLEVQKRLQEQALRAAERSLLESNLAFLKNQINPHFLFNSLNFLYAEVYAHSQSAAQGILLLSDTMRYALHEDNNGKVMLTQEVTHLHNYIALHQLRFHNRLQVQLDISGNMQFSMILPLVLITFVENCFKHGELADAAHPLVIQLAVVQNKLTFHTHNKKRHGPKEKSTGIGLVNTRRRLDIIYKSRYALAIDDAPDHYTCHLTIDL